MGGDNGYYNFGVWFGDKSKHNLAGSFNGPREGNGRHDLVQARALSTALREIERMDCTEMGKTISQIVIVTRESERTPDIRAFIAQYFDQEAEELWPWIGPWYESYIRDYPEVWQCLFDQIRSAAHPIFLHTVKHQDEMLLQAATLAENFRATIPTKSPDTVWNIETLCIPESTVANYEIPMGNGAGATPQEDEASSLAMYETPVGNEASADSTSQEDELEPLNDPNWADEHFAGWREDYTSRGWTPPP
ncbi:hypothetical protein N431DRAFT_525520 [Stipitochalara longipes BDJ]|nr:hypothetical protein N431DRAFT_525520 [Stipitochalara longipes BDJ]